MKFHKLKTWPAYFWPAYAEVKTFELRKNDRDFKVGDGLTLQEWDPDTNKYTGRELELEITYILDHHPGLADEYVVLGVQPLE